MDTFVDRPQRVSLEDIAQAIGVSKATVCRALLGRARVSEATRARVKAAAERLGYRPDPTLSALTKHRWAVGAVPRASYQVALIRVLGDDAGKRARVSINTDSAIEGMRRRCEELGFMLSEWVLEEQHSPQHLGRMLYSRGVDGLLINIEGPVRPWEFPWDHFAAVTLGHDQLFHPSHAVVPDWFRAITMAVEQARQAGYRRVGFASFWRRNPEIDDRLFGAIRLNRARLEEDFGPQPAVFEYPSAPVAGADIMEIDRERFAAWWRDERPDVVIDTNRIAYWWLRDLGVKLPREVGYITTVGNTSEGDEARLSSVSLRREHQGKTAVELLFNLLQLNQRGLPPHPVRVTVSCGWVAGETLGRARPVRRQRRAASGSA
jgi:LacI family transcriptional regulator